MILLSPCLHCGLTGPLSVVRHLTVEGSLRSGAVWVPLPTLPSSSKAGSASALFLTGSMVLDTDPKETLVPWEV